jgi:hypothetical protein
MGAPGPTAVEVRQSLVAALQADLVGPFEGDDSAEVLRIAPSRWYLTGFLAPKDDRETKDPTAEEELGSGADEEDEMEVAPEPEPKQRNCFPASLGLSVLLPAAEVGDTVDVTVSFAEYVREERDTGERKRKSTVWRRVPQPPRSVTLRLDPAEVEKGKALPDTPNVRVCGKLEQADAPGLDPGTRALSLFVVNERTPGAKGRQDEQFLFQVRMEVRFERGFLARPSRLGEGSEHPDEDTVDLQFRGHREWAVGHGVAVQVPHGAGDVTCICTTWIPACEVRKVDTHDEPNVLTSMDALGELADGAALEAALAPLVNAYGAWIEQQGTVSLDSVERKKTRDRLLKNARRAKDRIRNGIQLLTTDATACEAFRLMNRAMATAARQRSPERYAGDKKPVWRLFQLAFVLLSLVGIADPSNEEERCEVELIFFPTGGGKTEAYLGVIGFTLLLRRLRGQRRPDGGLGVAVLLRYTLRLLTLDQLGRAATLVCALELLRQKDPTRLGDVRFAVGLWVGRSATANTLEQVKKLIIDYKNSASKTAPSPFPLPNCPWCGRPLGRDSLVLAPNKTSPEEVIASCVSASGQPPSDCAFSPRNNREGLPVVFVDDQIYRELPAFIVATVDKFAMLPWRGETAMLFGKASAREGKQCFGPLDSIPKGATRLPDGLLPPDLIVQDELHLISGPLGTMVGLYETAIEWLSTRNVDGVTVPPKVIASTATVRRAREQISALFGRPRTSLFPPPGVDASETFFAKLDTTSPGRLYLGVAAPGRPLKAILLRTYVALLAAAQRQYQPGGGDAQPADAYMTLAGYFNSLRELGGMRRLVEDDVRKRCGNIEKRVPFEHDGSHPWGKNRPLEMPVELTSREKAGAIKEAKDRLARPFAAKEHVDVLLASNMISVGVDIDRLGLMVVAGQPKSTSEYIQASSRVGRQAPGLVVTCFNVRRPRDRSHYERFVAYHESFYRYVEATSLTPFSGPALDRGLTGTLVAMTRLGDLGMTAPASAMAIGDHQAYAEACVQAIARRGAAQADDDDEAKRLLATLRGRGTKVIEAWQKLVTTARHEAAGKRSYSPFDKDKTAGKALLYTVLDENQPEPHSDDARFAAPTSMRDVEPSVHLWLERRSLGGKR